MFNIIIDTDPGVDDALALLLAMCTNLPIQGITTVYGNASIENTTRNTLAIMDLLQVQYPVYKGKSTPLNKKAILATSHGESGLCNFTVNTVMAKVAPIDAVSYLKRIVSAPEPVDIICLGPLTNLATALQQMPAIAAKINRLIILGGCISEPGNITQYAEFNVYNDPDAWQIVLNTSISTVVIPINICRQITFNTAEITNAVSPELAASVELIIDSYIDYYKYDPMYGGHAGGVLYDVLAVLYVLRPDLFTVEPSSIAVDTTSSANRGETIISSSTSNCALVTNINVDALKQIFLDTLSYQKI